MTTPATDPARDDAHTTDPETTMPDDKTTAPEAPAPRTSQPPALDPWLARMDRVVSLGAAP